VYRILIGKSEGNISIRKPRRRLNVSLKWILGKGVGGCGLDSSGSI
jgi:hypothetical protein